MAKAAMSEFRAFVFSREPECTQNEAGTARTVGNKRRRILSRDVNGDCHQKWYAHRTVIKVRLSVFACTIIYDLPRQASAGDMAVTILKIDLGSLCSQILTQYPCRREVLCAWLHEVICIAGVLHSGGGKSGRLDISSGFSLHISSLVSYDKFHITSGSFSRA